MSAFFADIVQLDVQAKGFEGKLPVFYYDNTSMTAIYSASTAKVRPYLPHRDMHPSEIRPGRCLVAVSCFEYRRSDIDPYNELSIAVLVRFGRRPLPGLTVLSEIARRSFTAWVWHLPVTTERARAGGVDLYGYPKFIADIRFERTALETICTLTDGNSHVLTLRGKNLAARPGKRVRFRTYSIRDGVPLCANVLTNPLAFAQSSNGSAATLELGDAHPIARELRSIELGAKPILYQWMPRSEVILFGPRNLVDD